MRCHRTVSALTNGDLAFLTRNDVITVQHAYPELKVRAVLAVTMNCSDTWDNLGTTFRDGGT